MKYFAYGSNMDPNRMRDRNVHFSQRMHAVLKCRVLKFNKVATGKTAKPGEGKANIAFSETEIVEGALYEFPESDLQKLDNAEGYPKHYDYANVTVELDDGTKVEALTYMAQLNMVKEGLKPTNAYLAHLLAARDILTGPYIQKLMLWETVD